MAATPMLEQVGNITSLCVNHMHEQAIGKLRALGLTEEADAYRELVRQIDNLESEAYGICDDVYLAAKKRG